MQSATLVAERTIRLADSKPVDAPLQSDEVRVSVSSVGLCGSDLSSYLGAHPRMRPPLVLGHEFAGQVDAVGSAVTRVSIGDTVAVDPMLTCGQCRNCRDNRPNVCDDYRLIGCDPALPGALAGQVTVAARQVVALPSGMSTVEGALLQPLNISLHAITDRARVQKGDSVVVFGSGPIGLGCLAAAQVAGGRVVMCDIATDRLARAEALGADAVVDVSGDDAIARIIEAAGGPLDHAVEAAGGRQTSTLELSTEVVRKGGRVTVVGNFSSEVRGLDLAAMKVKELTVVAAQGYSSPLDKALDLLKHARLAEQLVSHRFAIGAAEEAFAALADPAQDTLKVVIDFSPTAGRR